MITTTGSRALAMKAKLFRGFSDLSRLSILETLRAGPRTVTRIVNETGLTQPNASNHLACLLDCGLVQRTRSGRHAFYSLRDERVGTLLGTAERLLAANAGGVDACRKYKVPASNRVSPSARLARSLSSPQTPTKLDSA